MLRFKEDIQSYIEFKAKQADVCAEDVIRALAEIIIEVKYEENDE